MLPSVAAFVFFAELIAAANTSGQVPIGADAARAQARRRPFGRSAARRRRTGPQNVLPASALALESERQASPHWRNHIAAGLRPLRRGCNQPDCSNTTLLFAPSSSPDR